MKPRERALIYTLLLFMLLMNSVVLLTVTARPALAGMRTLLDTLGPTDGVVFAGEDDNITLRNEEGHLVWSDNEHGRMYAFAFVDQQKIISKLLETETFKDERERLTEEIKAEQQDWNQREAGLREKYADFAGPDDPRAEEAQADFGELRAAFSEWQQLANQSVNDMAVSQLKQGYQEMLDAVDLIADQRGIDIVLRFTPRDEELAAGISGQTMLDIRMRTALRYPDGLDITPDVLDEMALD